MIIYLSALLLLLTCQQSDLVPKTHWQKYKSVEAAGFSKAKLDSIKTQLEALRTAAYLVISDGKVVFSYGDVTRRFRSASMRKSYLHLLLGRAWDQKKLNIDASLADLSIDDIQPLSMDEKSKTVKDLMMTNSHIFHPSAHMPRSMRDRLPKRHVSYDGWFYNNWDFNALGAIYNQVAASDLFKDFDAYVALPLQFEDFELKHTYYRYERDKSKHPAYLFRLSARDLARFGMLYLNGGKWGDQQIVSQEWFDLSMKAHITDLGVFNERGAYGYLWWVQENTKDGKIYNASGANGQRIYVIPEKNMVVVHLVNNYERNHVRNKDILDILSQTIAAKIKEPSTNSVTEDFTPKKLKLMHKVSINSIDYQQLLGEYNSRILGQFRIFEKEQRLYAEANLGIFELYAQTQNIFIPEDILMETHFIQTDDPKLKRQIMPKMNKNRQLEYVIFYY